MNEIQIKEVIIIVGREEKKNSLAPTPSPNRFVAVECRSHTKDQTSSNRNGIVLNGAFCAIQKHSLFR